MMGVKHLWTILTPYCERKPLYELQGKTVAVDLSCWICEAQNISEYQVQPRMYLRNLYFRTCYLLLLDTHPVFILEGKAPELKYDTIAARNAIQFKGAKPKTDGVKTGKDRSRFNFVLKRCEEMLGLMGLSCIKGEGEAESLCAYLNDEELVDGCISQDSDCFAYGAKIVYRNFSIASQGANKSSGGAVDIYDITKANESLNFGRNKIIAMALLLGSDYSDGVHGVGKESLFKFFEDLSDEETLDKLRSWRKNSEVYEKYENMLSDKNICPSCGHQGKVRAHTQNGCGPCGLLQGCSDQTYKEQRLKLKNELSMRSKALQDPDFPNETLITEFLTKKDHVTKLDLEWKQPNLAEFVRFTTKYLQWEEIYAFEKIFPILTRWQCINYKRLQTKNLNGIVHPSHIKKVRKPKGVPSYEIIWSDPAEYFKNVVPKEQIEGSNTAIETLWSTIEPQELVNKAYPKLVETFHQSKIKPKKPTRRKKDDAKVDEIEGMMKNSSISEPKPKKTRKTTKKKDKANGNDVLKVLESSFNELKLTNPVKKPTVLDNFLKRAVMQSHKNKQKELEDDIIDLDRENCHTSTPNKCPQNVLEMSCFGDEENDSGLSDIIDEIISRKPDDLKLLTKIKGIIKNMDGDLEKVHNREHSNNMNIDDAPKDIGADFLADNENKSSSFFISGPIENDMFEKTFNEMYNSDDNESTIEYDYNDVELSAGENDSENVQGNGEKADDEDKEVTAEDNEQIKNGNDEDEYSFCDSYVPLIERLKKKM